MWSTPWTSHTLAPVTDGLGRRNWASYLAGGDRVPACLNGAKGKAQLSTPSPDHKLGLTRSERKAEDASVGGLPGNDPEPDPAGLDVHNRTVVAWVRTPRHRSGETANEGDADLRDDDWTKRMVCDRVSAREWEISRTEGLLLSNHSARSVGRSARSNGDGALVSGPEAQSQVCNQQASSRRNPSEGTGYPDRLHGTRSVHSSTSTRKSLRSELWLHRARRISS